MKNEFIRILILHSMDNKIELIKNTIGNHHPKSVFLIAQSKASFFEKMKWMKPNLIISDLTLDDFSGTDALLFIKASHPTIPFLFVLEKCFSNDVLMTTLIKAADGDTTIDNLNDLPQIIESAFEQGSGERQKEIEKDNSIYESKKMLHKAMTYLNQAPDFEHKSIIENCLQHVGALDFGTTKEKSLIKNEEKIN